MTTPDLAKLATLVERCRVASADLEIARECGDQDDREGALGERDASERRLGAEWKAIGAALQDLQKMLRPDTDKAMTSDELTDLSRAIFRPAEAVPNETCHTFIMRAQTTQPDGTLKSEMLRFRRDILGGAE